jgi:hypothetical protein
MIDGSWSANLILGIGSPRSRRLIAAIKSTLHSKSFFLKSDPVTSDVISFDVTGSGATNAARFQVGQVSLNAGVPEGGGLTQNVLTAVYGKSCCHSGARCRSLPTFLLERIVEILIYSITGGDHEAPVRKASAG